MRVSSVRWGVIWIGIGLFFLAINLELLDSLVFPRLFALWPVLLIAFGVELLFRHTRFYFLAFLSPIIIACAFIAAASATGDWGWNADRIWRRWAWRVDDRKIDTVEIQRDSLVSHIDLNLECGSSTLSISPSSDLLFKATTEYYRRGPWTEHMQSGGTEKIKYENREKTRLAFLGLNVAAARSDFLVADYLPLKADIAAQNDRLDLDFSALKLYDLSLDIHSNKTNLRLGDMSDSVSIVIDGEMDKLDIVVPREMALRISGESPQIGRSLERAGMSSRDGAYFSGDYSSASRKARISLDAEIKSIAIDRD